MGGTGDLESGIGPMSSTRAEVHDAAASGGFHHTRSFRDRQALKVNLVQDQRFHQLRFYDRRDDLNDRLVWKNRRPFGQRVHLASETKILQPFQQRLGELLVLSYIVQLPVFEVEVRKKIDNVPDPGRDNIVAIRRHFAKRQFEYRKFIHTLAPHRPAPS